LARWGTVMGWTVVKRKSTTWPRLSEDAAGAVRSGRLRIPSCRVSGGEWSVR
jgi:hypothetical protein